MSPKSKSKTAKKRAAIMVSSIRREFGGIVELADGRLMLAQGNGINESVGRTTCRISKDGGTTWSRAKAFRCGMGVGGMIRLQSGALAIYGKKSKRDERKYYFTCSKDEGHTWSVPVQIPTHCDFHPLFHCMIELTSGRLIFVGCGQINHRALDTRRYSTGNWGVWRGAKLNMEGHLGPEMGFVLAYYSDDQGKTWQRSGGQHGGVFGWFNERGITDGTGGLTAVFEPTVAETKDGRLLMLLRCKRGRLAQCYSMDAGETWLSVQPSELSSSQSPAMLVSLPQTGDLLCVWNQISGEEIRRGPQRCRLSSAISKDSGQNWGHFKTIESCQGMADVGSIVPEFPIPEVLRGNAGPGKLPDGFANFDYPNVDIVGDKVILRYSRGWPILCNDGKAEMTGEGVMRIYPLAWFYK